MPRRRWGEPEDVSCPGTSPKACRRPWARRNHVTTSSPPATVISLKASGWCQWGRNGPIGSCSRPQPSVWNEGHPRGPVAARARREFSIGPGERRPVSPGQEVFDSPPRVRAFPAVAGWRVRVAKRTGNYREGSRR